MFSIANRLRLSNFRNKAKLKQRSKINQVKDDIIYKQLKFGADPDKDLNPVNPKKYFLEESSLSSYCTVTNIFLSAP